MTALIDFSEHIGQNTNVNLDRRLLQQARQAAGWLALTILLGIAAGLLVLFQARTLTRVIARVFLGGASLPQVAPLLGLLLGIFILRSLATLVAEVSASAVAVRVKHHLREMLFNKLLEIGPVQVQGERSGELSAALVQGVEALDAYFSQYLPQLVLAAALPLILLAAVFPLDLLSGVVLLVTAPLIPVFMVLIGSAAEALTRRQYTTLSRMSAFFLDTLQGLATLKALGQSQRQAERIQAVSQSYRAATMTVLRVTFLSALALELVASLSTAVIAVEIGVRLLYGQIGFEQAFFILVIAPEFYLPLRQLGLRFHAGMAGISAARRIFEILALPAESIAKAPAEPLKEVVEARPTVLPAQFSLSFEEVCFHYPGRETEALDGVSFSLHSGQHLAVVGASGSGKSTLALMLLRFLAPQSGRVLLDGRPVEEIPLAEWREWIAWVPQMPYLLHDTLVANLRIANANARMEELRQAAGWAGLDDFITSLPKGYETVIGEGGARLSGGQAQRLALARAFLKDAPILVLDEPAAHLDLELADQVQHALGEMSQGRAVLTIAHSLPTVRQADEVLVMERGRLVEMGTPQDVITRQGAFARLLRAYEGPP